MRRGGARPKQVVTTTVDGVRVHEIVAPEDPYVFAATSPRIKDGHVIVVGTVVGVRVLGYACAVTEDIGEFAVYDTEGGGAWATMMGGRYAGAYNTAVIVAAQLGAPLRRTRTKRRASAPKAARQTPAKTGTRAASATRTAAASKTASRVSSSAATGRAATPRRAVPGVQFTAADTNQRG